ncbi:MAG: hypothetical protein IKJ76_08385, partial [Fibrobacter sp.]|nr:hypothetical protein [Fibrobacter sp.]
FKCHNNRPLDFTAVKIEKCRPIAPLYGLPGLASGLCSGAWGLIHVEMAGVKCRDGIGRCWMVQLVL